MSTTQNRSGARSFSDVSRRLTTETKASFKSSEFWAYVLVAAGLFIASAVVDGEGPGGFTPTEVWRLVTFLTIGYMVSRGLAKAGSREPYWSDGTNSDRR
ncbi:MAG: hypothetical protein GEU74_13960 [Nitriliruptorales bacterium]|nr:hypothetical protein [Nitriliruptorales bacterium]